MGIRVRATQRGYYGQLREPGDEFTIDNEQHYAPAAQSYHAFGDQSTAPISGWMERIDGEDEPESEPRRLSPSDPRGTPVVQQQVKQDPFTRQGKGARAGI